MRLEFGYLIMTVGDVYYKLYLVLYMLYVCYQRVRREIDAHFCGEKIPKNNYFHEFNSF